MAKNVPSPEMELLMDGLSDCAGTGVSPQTPPPPPPDTASLLSVSNFLASKSVSQKRKITQLQKPLPTEKGDLRFVNQLIMMTKFLQWSDRQDGPV